MKLNQAHIKVVKNLQESNPQLILCGSLALILAGVMEKREINDIDFVLNERDRKSICNILYIMPDCYATNKQDKYVSYHGMSDSRNMYYTYNINLLVFDDDVKLNSEIVTVDNHKINIQDLDTMLHYKKKYNRTKDIKDLDNIANKCLEEIIST